MRTIAFYSYKGGVGRSITVTNLAVYLCELGATVAVIDMDLEAPGLHYKFDLLRDADLEIRTGTTNLLAQMSRGLLPELDQYFTVAYRPTTPSESKVFLMAAGDPRSDGYGSDLATIDWSYLGAEPGLDLFHEIKNWIENHLAADFLIIDSRTGLTPSAAIATALLPESVAVLANATDEHLEGTAVVVNAIGRSAELRGTTVTIQPILSRYLEMPSQRSETSTRPDTLRTLDDSLALLDDCFNGAMREISGRSVKLNAACVLHWDRSLQANERIEFAHGHVEIGTSTTLLDDYLRLFATLVEPEAVRPYLDGARNRAKNVLWDDPEETERILQTVVSISGSLVAFEDLLKLYALQRRGNDLIRVADRMFRIHKVIAEHPYLVDSLRQFQLRRELSGELSMEFLQAVSEKWSEDILLCLNLMLLTANRNSRLAIHIARNILDSYGDDPLVVKSVIGNLGHGDRNMEVEGVRQAMAAIDRLPASKTLFEACVGIVRYSDDTELATKILQVWPPLPELSADQAELYVELLSRAERRQDARELSLRHGVVFDEEGPIRGGIRPRTRKPY